MEVPEAFGLLQPRPEHFKAFQGAYIQALCFVPAVAVIRPGPGRVPASISGRRVPRQSVAVSLDSRLD